MKSPPRQGHGMSFENGVSADLVLINGFVYCLDENESVVEAVAVKDGRILFAGSAGDAGHYIFRETEVMDLEGRMVLPGFIETHIHSPGVMLTELFKINLYGASSLEEVESIIGNYIRDNPGETVYFGEGFDGTLFSGEELLKGPRKERLDALCSRVPLIMESLDGHTLWLNSKAFEVFHITEGTEIPGGVIEKNDQGRLWGTLKEAAESLVPRKEYTPAQMKEATAKFQDFLHSLGYTAILSISSSENPPYQTFKEMDDQGLLKMHVRASVVMEPDEDMEERIQEALRLREKYRSKHFDITTIKFFADGVVEGGTACLLEPYNADAGRGTDYYGTFLWDQDKLRQGFIAANKADFQIHVHSIGDGSTKRVLDALEDTRDQLPEKNYRNAITHLQLVAPGDIDRFKDLNIIASIQPYWHFKDPFNWEQMERKVLGERAEQEYPVQSFLEKGVVVTSSSDHSVTLLPDPLLAIQMGVTRNMSHSCARSCNLAPVESADDEKWLLNKKERASVRDMIKSFTSHSAYMLFMDHEAGSIEVGKSADLVVIDGNILETPSMKIEDLKVTATIFEGQVVYKREEAETPGPQ